MNDRINTIELKKAIGRAGAVFATKDVSEQPELRAAHRADAAHRNWHAFVGTAISKSQAVLGVTRVGKSPRGEMWSKLAEANGAAPAALASVSGAAPQDRLSPAGVGASLGPQSAGDPPFTARMRLHQSWWRAEVLKVPCGVGPDASSAKRYGNMLEPLDGNAGRNFLTEEIFGVVQRRMAENRGTLERYRLLHNLLSSQPMCFNLFGPLVDQPERAARIIRALVGDEVTRVRRVAIEWAPEPSSAYLDDRTAFDAVVEYERPDGALVLLGIETKLTDSFSLKPYDGERYRRWMRSATSPFLLESSSALALPRHNQLWRNHLLAIALRDRAASPYAAVRSAVVHHPLDRDGASAVASYQELLKPDDDTFSVWSLDKAVDAFDSAASSDERPWIDAFRRRYLSLAE